eukprot:gene7149-5142_t
MIRLLLLLTVLSLICSKYGTLANEKVKVRRAKGGPKRGPSEEAGSKPKPAARKQPPGDSPTEMKGPPQRSYTIQRRGNNTLAPDLDDPIFHSRFATKKRSKPVNVLLILADDLGFGDTSVEPFIGTGIRTPRLEKMAARGAILTNFHAAAPTCTPSRASLLTGMYPWRAGIKSVFEYGERNGKSNRDDWLVQVPTAPMLFAEHGYKTFHSGKWHLGGMRNDDYSMRMLPQKATYSESNGRRCPHPGPNQQGFQTYVSVLDGPGAPRQNELQVQDTLYSQGCRHLLENDNPLDHGAYNISGHLSHCEARHAMRAMSDSVKTNTPFFIHLWFHAPHGPWEYIPGYDRFYPEIRQPSSPYDKDVPNCNHPRAKRFRYCFVDNGGGKRRINDRGLNRLLKYMTMVSDMDAQIGMVLDHIDQLGIAKDTIVVFTSDNGPEDDAGTSGGLRERKRSIYEGGLRVPAIVQWEGTIPAGSAVNTMAISTDVFPTFLDAAGIALPSHYKIDGTSILPDLLAATRLPSHGALTVPSVSTTTADTSATVHATSEAYSLTQLERASWLHASNVPVNRTAPSAGNLLGLPQEAHPLLFAPLQLTNRDPAGHVRRRSVRRQVDQERLLLWHADFESPRRTAGVAYGFKVILDENDVPLDMFDLSIDPREQNGLLPLIIPTTTTNSIERTNFWKEFASSWPNVPMPGGEPAGTSVATATAAAAANVLSSLVGGLSTLGGTPPPSSSSSHRSPAQQLTPDQVLYQRQQPAVIYRVLFHLYPALRAFATHGSDGYQAYVNQYPELRYPPTPPSHERPMITNIYKTMTAERMKGFVADFLRQNLCTTTSPCQCEIPQAKDVRPLPFPREIGRDAVASTIAVPHGYINASVLLFDNWF